MTQSRIDRLPELLEFFQDWSEAAYDGMEGADAPEFHVEERNYILCGEIAMRIKAILRQNEELQKHYELKDLL